MANEHRSTGSGSLLLIALLAMAAVLVPRMPSAAVAPHPAPTTQATPTPARDIRDKTSQDKVPLAFDLLREAFEFAPEVLPGFETAASVAHDAAKKTVDKEDKSAPNNENREQESNPAPAINPLQARRDGFEKAWQDLRTRMDSLNSGVQFRFLIVTVPDPIDSHLQIAFDTQLAAIQSGLEQHGFLLTGFHFPWKDAIRDKTASEPLNLAYRRTPGVMLFRKKPDEVLLLLLVGETPTGGVHRVALGEALDLAASGKEHFEEDCGHLDLSMLGPTYSGSSLSIRETSQAWWQSWRDDFPQFCSADFTLVSGNATADSNKEQLHVNQEGLSIDFSATVNPDRATTKEMIDYLVENRHVPLRHIALVKESGTVYGSNVNRMDGSPSGDGRTTEETIRQVLELRYPMHIGRLRSEYEKQPVVGSSADNKSGESRLRHLDVSLEEAPYSSDIVPAFSELSAAVAERQLENILATISRRDIRALGLAGTDVRDILFLAAEVRQHFPDVQLFALDSDLLFSHAESAHALDGMLVGSTYPLFINNQPWTSINRHAEITTYQFPSGSAEGAFNATLALLNAWYPEAPRPLYDYQLPFNLSDHPRRPPLWLTITGGGAQWPIAAIPLDGDSQTKAYVFPDPCTAAGNWKFTLKGYPTLVFVVVSSLAGLVCCFLFLLANAFMDRWSPWFPRTWLTTLRSSRLGTGLWLSFAPLPLSASRRDPSRRSRSTRQSRLLAAAFFSGLLIAHTAIASPIWALVMADLAPVHDFNADSLMWLPSLALSALAFSSLLWYCMILTVLCVATRRSWGERALNCILTSVLLQIAVLIGAVAWPFLFRGAISRLDAAVFAERAGSASGGVSPVTPIVLIGVALSTWASCNLWRVHYLKLFRITSPLGRGAHAYTSGFVHKVGDLVYGLKRRPYLPCRLSDLIFCTSP